MSRRFGCGCGILSFGKKKSRFSNLLERFRKLSRTVRPRRFGAFTGGSPNTLLNMQGPYGFGRKRRSSKRSCFGAFTGGSPNTLLNMQGPYGFGRRRRCSRRFGAFTGGSPNTLLNMEGPYGFGRKKMRLSKKQKDLLERTVNGESPEKTKKRLRKIKRNFQKSLKSRKGCHYSGMHSVGFGRRFGLTGEGYTGLTTYPNVSAPYFGSAEPFVNASGWWYPVTEYNGGLQVQSPQNLIA